MRILGLLILVLALAASASLHLLVEGLVWLAIAATGVLLLAVFSLAALLGALLPRRPPRLPTDRGADAAVSVVVPSWNGLPMLQRLVPSVVDDLRSVPGDHQIIVVDNGSDDGTAEWLADAHPKVEVVALTENRFYGGGVSAGARRATRPVLVLLNNDMVVEPGFFAALLAGVAGERVFAATAQITLPDGRTQQESGKTRGWFERGALLLSHRPISPADERVGSVPAFWAGGGSSAFDRATYEALGGMDPIYDPFYLEDTDLSYRAWSQGVQVLYVPAARVRHEHRGTVRRFGDAFVARMLRRNHYQFTWINLGDPGAIASHCLWLAPAAIGRARQQAGPGRAALWGEVTALASAVWRLPRILPRRLQRQRSRVLDDAQVWQRANRGPRPAPPPAPSAGAPMPSLNLLVLAARLPRLDTDGSWILFNRLAEQVRHHRVTLFAYLDRAEDAEYEAPLRALGIDVRSHLRSPGRNELDVHHRVPRRLARDYSAAPMRLALRNVLETVDFDVLQVEYVEMAHLLDGMLEELPAVYTVHESLTVLHRRLHERAAGVARWRAAWQWAQALRYEQQLLSGFRRAVALSATDADALRDAGAALPITVIPSGIDERRFAPMPEVVEQPIISFVGYYQHPPNIDGAVWLAREVFPVVRRAVPGAVLRIVGREPSPQVEALRDVAGVEVCGFVADLRRAMAESAVMAVPVRLGGGLRGKVLEAWSAGKAVVTTAVGAEGLPAVHRENALIADDAPAFAAALVELLSDDEQRARLGAAGRELVCDRFSAAAVARAYDQVYRQLLWGGGGDAER